MSIEPTCFRNEQAGESEVAFAIKRSRQENYRSTRVLLFGAESQTRLRSSSFVGTIWDGTSPHRLYSQMQ